MSIRIYKGSVFSPGDRVVADDIGVGVVEKITKGGAQVHAVLDNGIKVQRHASLWSHLDTEEEPNSPRIVKETDDYVDIVIPEPKWTDRDGKPIVDDERSTD